MPVITMGGLAGGGARTVGPIVAQRLGADYVDRLLLTNVARHVGATVEALSQREERPPTTGERISKILQRILERSAVTGAGGDPYFGPGVSSFFSEEYENLPQPTITRGHELEDEKYIEGIRKVLRELAAAGNVVIIGRGAYVLLKDWPKVLRVGIAATMEDRIATLMQRERLDRDKAIKTIQARDRARSLYFKRFFNIDRPDDPALFHLVLNMSEVSSEYAAETIIAAAAALDAGKLARGKVGAIA